MPEFLKQYLSSLDAAQAQKVWDWADGYSDAINEIIDIVAPIAAPD